MVASFRTAFELVDELGCGLTIPRTIGSMAQLSDMHISQLLELSQLLLVHAYLLLECLLQVFFHDLPHDPRVLEFLDFFSPFLAHHLVFDLHADFLGLNLVD